MLEYDRIDISEGIDINNSSLIDKMGVLQFFYEFFLVIYKK